MTSRRPYWRPKTMKGRPFWGFQTNPMGVELFSYANVTISFVPINLHRCWSHEGRPSILSGGIHRNASRTLDFEPLLW